MERRLKLHAELKKIHENVYFQPPEAHKIQYPCYIYHLNDADSMHADDNNYVNRKRYTVTYITRNPDDDSVNAILNTFKYSSFDRWYSSDNLHHFVFNIYY